MRPQDRFVVRATPARDLVTCDTLTEACAIAASIGGSVYDRVLARIVAVAKGWP